MNDQETNRKPTPTKKHSRNEILASAADQLADIIYQNIRYRESDRNDGIPTRPLPS